MRDYVDYFNDRKRPEKHGVSEIRDIDWWMEYCTGRIAKLLFIVLLAVLALVLKSFWQVGKSRHVFPVDHVTLSGDVLITSPEDVNRALADVIDDSFFTVDLNAVSTRLTDLPWIESATVVRRWPNTLDIYLVERQATYRWCDHELIDADGNRFANIDNSIFGDLPKLNGVDGAEIQMISAYRQLMSDLGASAEHLAIEQLKLNQYLSWELHLQSGVVIKFGRDDYAQRMTRFAQFFQTSQLPAFDQLDTLDFRYHRGFAVKWKPEYQSQQQGKLVKVSAVGI